LSGEHTFDALWMETGLVESDAPPRETLREPHSHATTQGAELPHLSIHEDRVKAPTDAQLVIKEVLGQGGMGIVHLAQQPLLNRHVAIKRVRDDAPASAAGSLFREARYMGSLEHPNIIPVHALGADAAGRPILVMKCIDGVSWSRLIAEPHHPAWARWTGWSDDPVERNLEILIEVCRALTFAHSRQILHRDIKPDNVMLGEYGEVYVLDWGVAMHLDRPRQRGIVGTPAYMAPEMVEPEGVLDERTDVFLLGACLHEVLSGHPPHRGSSLKTVLAAAHLSQLPALDGVSADLKGIVHRAMAASPAQRFASPADLREQLSSWLRNRGSVVLAKAATEKLDHLVDLLSVPEPHPTAVSSAYTASLFGFEQALQAWPENTEARTGLQSAYRQMAGYQITRKNLDHAAALIAKLDLPGPLSTTLAKARKHEARRHTLEREEDWELGVRERLFFWCGLTVVGVGSTAVVFSGAASDPLTFTPLHLVVLAAGMLGVCVVLTTLGRHRLYGNRVNASVTDAVLAVMLMITLHRVLQWQVLHSEVAQILAIDALILASCWATLKRTIGSIAWILSSGSLVTCLLIVAFPHAAIYLFGSALALGVVAGVVAFGRLGASAAT
jgi:eukaryotic-like serine/threonine-protein kinase